MQPVLEGGLFEGFKRRRAKAGEHGSAGKMSPRLTLLKHKVRAASRLVNNLKNCSGKKPAAAAAATSQRRKNRRLAKIEKSGSEQNGEQRPSKDFHPAFAEIKRTKPTHLWQSSYKWIILWSKRLQLGRSLNFISVTRAVLQLIHYAVGLTLPLLQHFLKSLLHHHVAVWPLVLTAVRLHGGPQA